MVFTRDAEDAVEEIKSLPRQARYGINRVVEALKPAVSNGLESVILFGVPSNLPKVCRFLSCVDTDRINTIKSTVLLTSSCMTYDMHSVYRQG